MVLSVSTLNEAPISIDTVEYDFEKFALQHGIPETVDPLPYRKTGSVFSSDYNNNNNDQQNQQQASAANNEGTTNTGNNNMLTSAKYDPRLRTVVCRHWLRDLCMKGTACEFLHQYDLIKMPLCRHGDRCKIKDCPFRHISDTERLECAFYKSGFCIHGPFCRYKHAKRSREDIPIVADFALGLSQMQQAAATSKDGSIDKSLMLQRRPAPKPNEFYKISLCKHFAAGECPFGDHCHFAHGEHELKNYPRKQDNAIVTMEDGSTNLSDHVFGNTDHPTAALDYFQGGGAGGGRTCPILDPNQAHYFMICAATQRDVAISTVQQEWYVQSKHAALFNSAYGTTMTTAPQVMIFFTVALSRHIQGAAMMTSPCMYQASLDIKNDAGDDDPYCYRFTLEWYRTTELPVRMALEAAPNLIVPTRKAEACHEMNQPTGEALMKALWNAPLVTLYESWSDEIPLPTPDQYGMELRAPMNENEIAWPIMPGPGYLFGCSSDTMDECLGLGIFGLPAHMQASASGIDVGTTIFLFNVTDRLLFGIFEALTPAIMNISPTAFSKNPKATTSPFPVQVRVRISLECPPLEDTDPVLNDILRARGHGRIGPLTYAQSEAIATLLANQCGALQYMIDYQNGVRNGANVRPPPIALPPKKIIRKDTTTGANSGTTNNEQ